MESNQPSQILEFSKKVHIFIAVLFLVALRQWSILFIVWLLSIHSIMEFRPCLYWEVEENRIRANSECMGSISAKCWHKFSDHYFASIWSSPQYSLHFINHVHIRKWELNWFMPCSVSSRWQIWDLILGFDFENSWYNRKQPLKIVACQW